MRASPRRGRPLTGFLTLAAVALAADQLAKQAALRLLQPEAPLPLLGPWLALTLTHNPASAFGLVSARWALLVSSALLCLAIIAYAAFGGGLSRRPDYAAPLGLVLGGSLGNLLDRLRLGAVVDFVDLGWWPVFNLADVTITAGFALLTLRLVRPRHAAPGGP